jgi:hypothetical protein
LSETGAEELLAIAVVDHNLFGFIGGIQPAMISRTTSGDEIDVRLATGYLDAYYAGAEELAHASAPPSVPVSVPFRCESLA